MLPYRALQCSIRSKLAIRRPFSASVPLCLSKDPQAALELLSNPELLSTLTTPSVIDVCPSSSCTCAPMPDGLDIDHSQPLLGTVPSYDRHVIFCTGKEDWTPRVEDENKGANITKILKELMGPKGRLHNPNRNLLMTNSSITTGLPSTNPEHLTHSVDAYMFPEFNRLKNVDYNSNIHLAYLAGALPLRYFTDNASSNPLEKMPKGYGKNRYECSRAIGLDTPIKHPVILICGHGSRDKRCGILGPLLKIEFERALQRHDFRVPQSPGAQLPAKHQTDPEVALISHIGGHKWAGNVIIYIPPSYETLEWHVSPLAGKGIWYGRVEPRHIEGIVKETVIGGRIIKDLFRGGIHQNRKPLHL